MNERECEELLADAEVVPCLTASVPDAKELFAVCLEADIPIALERDSCCGKGGCGCAPKLQLLARPDDLPRVKALLDERWRALAEREGILSATWVDARETEGEPPCPACGTAAPLVEGACAECGLQLA